MYTALPSVAPFTFTVITLLPPSYTEVIVTVASRLPVMEPFSTSNTALPLSIVKSLPFCPKNKLSSLSASSTYVPSGICEYSQSSPSITSAALFSSTICSMVLPQRVHDLIARPVSVAVAGRITVYTSLCPSAGIFVSLFCPHITQVCSITPSFSQVASVRDMVTNAQSCSEIFSSISSVIVSVVTPVILSVLTFSET